MVKMFSFFKSKESANYCVFAEKDPAKAEMENGKGQKVQKAVIASAPLYIAKSVANGSEEWVLIERSELDRMVKAGGAKTKK